MILPSDPYTTFWDVTRRNWTQLDATPFGMQLLLGCNFNIVKIVHFGQKYAVVGITFSFFFKPCCAKCNQPAHICNEQAFSFFL